MIKLSYCLRRLPELSRQEFQDYWLNRHGPLVRGHAAVLKIKRYVQLHTLDTPLNDVLREGRGGPDAFDGVAELWWENVDRLEQVFNDPEAEEPMRELLEDEKKFIDLANSPLWLAEERAIVG